MGPMIRNIGSLLVKGFKPRDIFTQHMGRYTSPTFGKDNTSHFGDLKVHHVVSPISMLGDLIPVMTGVAMAGRYLGQNIVAMTWIGDGGSSTGAFHEGLNLAATQRAPFVLILENNQWAYSTPVSHQVPLKNLADRALAYGIASKIVDGNDVVAVYEAAKDAVEECRAGRGPVLIEVKTMRMKGHAQHDEAQYVPKAMFEFWKAQDPIQRYEAYLTEHKLWDAKKKSEDRCTHRTRIGRGPEICGRIPDAAPRNRRAGCLLRRLPHDSSGVAPSEKRSDAAGIEREAGLGSRDFGAFAVHAAKSPNPEARPSAIVPAAAAKAPLQASAPLEAEVPLRVPFGRGPKDKSFELERRDKPAGKPPRHKGRGRRR